MTRTVNLDNAHINKTEEPINSDWIVLVDNTTSKTGEHGEADGHEGHEAAETGHGESIGMPQFNVSTFPNQLAWLAITLVIIYFILAKIALPRIGGVLEQRSTTILRDLDRAAELKNKAASAEANYHLALNDARAKAQTLGEEAKAKAQAKLDQAILKADKELGVLAKESAARIAEMSANAEKSVAEIARAITGDIVKAMNPNAHDENAVEKTLAKLLKG